MECLGGLEGGSIAYPPPPPPPRPQLVTPLPPISSYFVLLSTTTEQALGFSFMNLNFVIKYLILN